MMPRFDAPNLHHSAVLFYQLTRPRGARHAARQRTAHGDAVSTHAPTRGATGTLAIYSDVRSGFNSRAREGRDRGILQALSANVKSLVFRERQPERGAMRNI